MEYEFANKGKKLEAMQIKTIIENSTWKNSQKYFKKNSVVYGKEFHEFIYLDNRLEREACDTLRRIDRLLRLSKERGYPVLNKDVAAPHNYNTNTSTHRDTTFGVNNYDRTQSYPPVQPAPLIMAAEGDGESTSIKVEDSQPPFDRRDMVKRTKLVKVLKAETNTEDIYYNHPLYRSKQKKQSNESIQSNRGPPPRGLPSEDRDELNRAREEMKVLDAQFDAYEKERDDLDDEISEVEKTLDGDSLKQAGVIKFKKRLQRLKEYKKETQQKYFDVGSKIEIVEFEMSKLEGPQEDSFTLQVKDDIEALSEQYELTKGKLREAIRDGNDPVSKKLRKKLIEISNKIEEKEEIRKKGLKNSGRLY